MRGNGAEADLGTGGLESETEYREAMRAILREAHTLEMLASDSLFRSISPTWPRIPLATIVGDPASIARIPISVVHNALKFAGDGGTIDDVAVGSFSPTSSPRRRERSSWPTVSPRCARVVVTFPAAP